MEDITTVTYASSLTDICEYNSSFDKGTLAVCYHGKNRNKTFISKETLLRCAQKSLKYVPVVCNYIREVDEIGGHDREIVQDSDGQYKFVNITDPVGVVPECLDIRFEDITEEDGSVNEYLKIDVLLWKRQEAYSKIKNNGVTAHSMEIKILDGELKDDGYYYVYDFEFTALCLLGNCEPCFESSALEVFSLNQKEDFKKQMEEMMQDLKEEFSVIKTSNEVDNIHPQNKMTEGGTQVLDTIKELAAKYEIELEGLDFSVEELSLEELEEKFKLMNENKAADIEPEATPIDTEDSNEDFALTGNIVEELHRILEEVKIEREWGESTRYWYTDSDFELSEVYCWDTQDWLLYGFKYTTEGDKITIDFDSKQRMKYVIEKFEGGEQASPFAQTYSELAGMIGEGLKLKQEFEDVSNKYALVEKEVEELRQFKTDIEKAELKAKKDEVFAKFSQLNGVEEFELLKANCEEIDLEALEEKCFAIRGRNYMVENFALSEGSSSKIVIDKSLVSRGFGANKDKTALPYNGVVEEYAEKNL